MADLGKVYLSDDKSYKSLCLLWEAAGDTAAPLNEDLTGGHALRLLLPDSRPADLLAATLKLWNSASATATSFRIRAWVYDSLAAVWIPIGVGSGTTSGLLNEGNLIEVVDTNVIRFTQPVDLLAHFSGIYLQVLDTTGANLKLNASLSISV